MDRGNYEQLIFKLAIAAVVVWLAVEIVKAVRSYGHYWNVARENEIAPTIPNVADSIETEDLSGDPIAESESLTY